MRSELALYESAATRYICQMRSVSASNRTRRVGAVNLRAVALGHVANTHYLFYWAGKGITYQRMCV